MAVATLTKPKEPRVYVSRAALAHRHTMPGLALTYLLTTRDTWKR